MEIQTSGCEIIGILKKLKDEMSADLADSQKEDEEERKTDHAPLDAQCEIVTVIEIQTNASPHHTPHHTTPHHLPHTRDTLQRK